MKIKNKNKKTTLIIIAVILVAVLSGLAFAYQQSQEAEKKEEASKAKNEKPVNKVDYGPPTDEEKRAGDAQKQESQKQEELDQLAVTTKAEVTITDAAQYGSVIEIRAFTPNVYEDGGSCTAVLTKSGAKQVSVSHPAIRDAQTTQCGGLDIPRSSFSQSGNWKLVVSYSSPTSQGSSKEKIVTIK